MLSDKLLGTYAYTIPQSDGRAIAWLYANGQVMDHREDEKNTSAAHYHVRLSAANASRFDREFGY